jgi:predicted amino acid racemase
MFLEALKRRNPNLLRAAAELAIERRIPPNTFVLDLDTTAENGDAIRAAANKLGLSLYFMMKQVGRNPLVTKVLVAEGRRETVSVDIACVNAFAAHGIRLGHVGNLVQTPVIDIPRVLALDPEVITVFSVAKARQISEAAVRLGRIQDLLIRVANTAQDIYLPGMEGGIEIGNLAVAAGEIMKLSGARTVGVTTFPALVYGGADSPKPAPNFATLATARDILEKLGVHVVQVNAPGNTSCVTLALQAERGATHVEPGHGFLGTTPFHLSHPNLPERPAACYVTEVAHHYGGRAYVYGGGFFIDDPVWLNPRFRRKALVGETVGELLDHEEPFIGAGAGTTGSFGGIDYYGFLDASESRAPVGASVLMGFRIQSFVTRANIAVISDCGSRSPQLHGLYDQLGNRITEHG